MLELDENAKEAVRQLGAVINRAIEKSASVGEAIERLRELGFEPQLTLKLEIGLLKISDDFDEFPEEFELDLTDEDLRTLRRMKIKISE